MTQYWHTSSTIGYLVLRDDQQSSVGYDFRLKCAARGSLKIQDAKKSPQIAIWAPSHNFVGLYLRNEGTYRQSEKSC